MAADRINLRLFSQKAQRAARREPARLDEQGGIRKKETENEKRRRYKKDCWHKKSSIGIDPCRIADNGSDSSHTQKCTLQGRNAAHEPGIPSERSEHYGDLRNGSRGI